MKHSVFCWCALLFCAASTLSAATPDNSTAVFSILPKSFQKNPHVDFNVITEMTNEGRKATRPGPNAPVYYLSRPGSFVQLGHGASAREKPPEVERMETTIEKSLAESGYLAASEGHPPTVVIIYSWGSHSSPIEDGVNDDSSTETASTVSNEVLINELVERARLVGGDKFAQKLVKAMAEEGAAKRATYKPRQDPTGGVPGQPNIMGEASGMMTRVFNPIERFRESSSKNRSLLEDAGSSVYFVVASAYDFASAKTDSKILLWRTKMSVNSAGLSLPETLPSLITAAAPYFGKDMTEAEVLGQRIHREGTVKLAPLEIKNYYDNVPPPAATKEGSAPSPAPAAEEKSKP